jgi:hypothetical protein
MRTVVTIVCLGVLIADMGFCGGSRALNSWEQAKFDASYKAANDRLSAAEKEWKSLEEAPADPAVADLAEFDTKLGEVEKLVEQVNRDRGRDPEAGGRFGALNDRYLTIDRRLTAIYQRRLGADAWARLHAALRYDQDWDRYDRSWKAVEEGTAPGQEFVEVYYQGNRPLTVRWQTALREIGDHITDGERACAAVREFIDGPSRDQIRAKQRATLEKVAARYADLAKRLDAVRKAHGIE